MIGKKAGRLAIKVLVRYVVDLIDYDRDPDQRKVLGEF